MINYGYIDLHFAAIRNPVLFYIGAVSTTEALLMIGKKIQPECVVWCGRESLLLILAQTGMVYICYIVETLLHISERPYAVVLVTAVAILIVSLVISYFAIQLIYSTFLRYMIIPPRKKVY